MRPGLHHRADQLAHIAELLSEIFSPTTSAHRARGLALFLLTQRQSYLTHAQVVALKAYIVATEPPGLPAAPDDADDGGDGDAPGNASRQPGRRRHINDQR